MFNAIRELEMLALLESRTVGGRPVCGCPTRCVTALWAVEVLTSVFPELQAIVFLSGQH